MTKPADDGVRSHAPGRGRAGVTRGAAILIFPVRSGVHRAFRRDPNRTARATERTDPSLLIDALSASPFTAFPARRTTVKAQ